MSDRQTPEPDGSPTLFPNDHLRALIELMRPAGADLARRWVAALLIVPPEEREGLVEAIEERIVSAYPAPGSGALPTEEDA